MSVRASRHFPASTPWSGGAVAIALILLGVLALPRLPGAGDQGGPSALSLVLSTVVVVGLAASGWWTIRYVESWATLPRLGELFASIPRVNDRVSHVRWTLRWSIWTLCAVVAQAIWRAPLVAVVATSGAVPTSTAETIYGFVDLVLLLFLLGALYAASWPLVVAATRFVLDTLLPTIEGGREAWVDARLVASVAAAGAETPTLGLATVSSATRAAERDARSVAETRAAAEARLGESLRATAATPALPETQPAEPTRGVAETQRATDTGLAETMQSAESARPAAPRTAEETRVADVARPLEETVAADETVPADATIAANPTRPVEETLAADAAVAADETVPADATRTVAEIVATAEKLAGDAPRTVEETLAAEETAVGDATLAADATRTDAEARTSPTERDTR